MRLLYLFGLKKGGIPAFMLVFSFVAQADQLDFLKHAEQQTNTAPYSSYQTLLSLESEAVDSGPETELRWLKEKAYAENSLYFYQEFDTTVRRAYQLIDVNTEAEIVASFMLFAGIAAVRDAEYAKALEFYRKALAESQKHSLHRIYLHAKQNIAYVLSLTQLYETSLNEIQQAYVDAFALDDKLLVAVINETYGAIYGYMAEYEKSIDYYHKALETYRALNYPAYIAEATYGLASTYRYWGKYQKAIEEFRNYQQILSYTPNVEVSYFAAYGLGMTLAEDKQCQAALPVISQAFTLNGPKDYDAELYKRRATCFIALNQLKEAEKALAQARDILFGIEELNGTSWQLDIVKIEAELAKANGNLEQAYDLLHSYQEKNEALYKKNASERLISVRASLEYERQKTEISLLKQQARVQSLEVVRKQQQNQQQRYLIVFILLIVIYIATLLVTQRRNNAKMKQLTIIDPLSQVYNRRYMFEYLNSLVDGKEDKLSFALMVFDIDDFKKINDNFGHPIGDQVIKQVAKQAKKTLRQQDVFGRIGGEEFMAILPRIAAEQAHDIAERLLTAISQHGVPLTTGAKLEPVSSDRVEVTVSIGVANYSSTLADSQTLYSCADKALYQAKRAGKAQVVSYHAS
ncbi:diguanylate cyclase [Endozoicomonas sp. G2_1]|uniref:tetratricopeptide repeat-containing diguanylate cyclase n=1 Tax=Endozoicomonas sp. G2_1 TaxID=2821091 RepID=UPI001ADD18FB|nr:diguanylate cyclase [Endozoicomonas sp. G2_1]MBO9489386.1 diguanylate cyclase [Endozoicomonas sp. G2_1]